MADNLHLLRLAKDGDERARDQLVSQNMGLVMSIAKRYVGRGQELCDLLQIGSIGLIKAIDRFDMNYDVQFSTYAVPMIQGEIRRFLRDDGLVKVSRRLREIHYKAEKYRMETVRNKGTEPTVNDICQALQVTNEELTMAMETATEVASIYDMSEELSCAPENEKIVDRLYVTQMIGKLPEKERELIVFRFFENKTQGQVGEILGMSQVQISRLEKKILKKLREQ